MSMDKLVEVEDCVLVTIEDGVGWVRLNRPDRLNALTYPILGRLCDVLDSLASDSAVRALVLAATGRAFCAGADTRGLAERKGMDPEARRRRIDEYSRASFLLHTMAKPTIAAVNGAAVGMGVSLVLACDLRVLAEEAKLIPGFAAIGTSGDFGISWFATRLAGPGRALRLLMLGERLEAREALAAGLADDVVPGADLEATVGALARRLASGPTQAFARMKANVSAAAGSDLARFLPEESRRMVECLMTEDHQEGLAAMAEKRPPRFSGR